MLLDKRMHAKQGVEITQFVKITNKDVPRVHAEWYTMADSVLAASQNRVVNYWKSVS